MLRGSVLGLAGSVGTPLFAKAPDSIGLSLPLTGVQAEVGEELRMGYELALKAAGAQLSIQLLDDFGQADKTAENMKVFSGDSRIIAASGVVGTPNAQAALPIAIGAGLPVVGLRSGAQSLRDGKEGVFHLRSSFEQELNVVAKLCAGAGFKRMAVLYSDDSFGKSSRDHFVKRLAELGVDAPANLQVATERSGKQLAQATEQIAQVIQAGTSNMGIALLLISKPMVQAVKLFRETHKLIVPMFAMSFVVTQKLATLHDPSLGGLGLVTAFPLPRPSVDVLPRIFKQVATEAGKQNIIESVTAYEGFFYGTVIAQAAKFSGSREALIRKLHAGMQFGETGIRFNHELVGYNYLQVVSKSALDGRLRT